MAKRDNITKTGKGGMGKYRANIHHVLVDVNEGPEIIDDCPEPVPHQSSQHCIDFLLQWYNSCYIYGLLKKLIGRNPFTNSRAIKLALELEACDRTIRRRLHANGIHQPDSGSEAKTSRTTQDNGSVFASEYINNDMNFWSKVIFTDEKTFSSAGYGPYIAGVLITHDMNKHIMKKPGVDT
ncbi:hypothetical protein Avbf_00882, partial [Armadillidium vulgare]